MTRSQSDNGAGYQYIAENVKRIRDTVEEAKVKCGREREDVHIMAVTKTVEPEAVNYAIGCGLTLLGENRVQELLSKYDAYDKAASIHFIGHLQTNKVKYIADKVTMIQSVDSFKLAEEIDKRCAALNRSMDVLLEVNTGGEESKSGVSPEQLEELLHQTATLPHIRIRGLMTIPPVGGSVKYFSIMQRIFIDIRAEKIDNVTMDYLSMGMSGDYAEAVLHGANIIRIGTVLFGARK